MSDSIKIIKVDISDNKEKISFEMEDTDVFKDPRLKIKKTRWKAEVEGLFLNIPTHDSNLKALFQEAIKLFEAMGYKVEGRKGRGIIENIQQQQDLFLESCKNARNVWDGDLETEDFKEFSKIVQGRFPKITLYPKQLLSAYHLAASQSACNFSVPGAGKTIIVLAAYAYLNSLPDEDPRKVNSIFVVGPISCFKPWETDFKLCFDRNIRSVRFLSSINLQERRRIVRGIDAKHRNDELYLSHFQTFSLNQKLFSELFQRPDKRVMLVIDEAHNIKGIDKVWSSAMLKAAPDVNSRVILTGTPAPNGYEDLKNLFDFIHPGKNILGFNINQLKRMSKGATSSQPLNDVAKSFFTRITKKNLDIPGQTFTPVSIPMSARQEKIYRLIENKVVSGQKKSKVFMHANLIRLRQAASNPLQLVEPIEKELLNNNLIEDSDDAHNLMSINNVSIQIDDFKNETDLPKLDYLIKIAKEAKDKKERILIWTYFVKNVDLINKHLRSHITGVPIYEITGATPVEQAETTYDPEVELTREKTLEKFRASSPSILIATPQCIGESISLHKECHKAIYYDRDYNCGLFIQSKDRIHRVGLDASTITEYIFLVSKDTVDEQIAEKLNDKENRMMTMLESEGIPLLSESSEENQLEIIESIVKAYNARQL